jgi:hypothetical protein
MPVVVVAEIAVVTVEFESSNPTNQNGKRTKRKQNEIITERASERESEHKSFFTIFNVTLSLTCRFCTI